MMQKPNILCEHFMKIRKAGDSDGVRSHFIRLLTDPFPEADPMFHGPLTVRLRIGAVC